MQRTLLTLALAISCVTTCSPALGQRKLDGKWYASGVLDVTGTLKLAGTAVTASAAEINAADITACGTVQASKLVCSDSNKDVGTFRNVTLNGTLTTGSTGLSEAELGVLDSVTAGTVTASKAAVPDSNKDIGSFASLTANQYRVTNAAQLSAANPTPTKANMQAASFWSVTTASNAVDVDLPAMDAADVGTMKRFAVTTGHGTQALTVTSGTLTVTTHNTLGTTCEDAQDHIDCLITSTTTASCDTFCAD